MERFDLNNGLKQKWFMMQMSNPLFGPKKMFLYSIKFRFASTVQCQMIESAKTRNQPENKQKPV
jgi:hypothetical protein